LIENFRGKFWALEVAVPILGEDEGEHDKQEEVQEDVEFQVVLGDKDSVFMLDLHQVPAPAQVLGPVLALVRRVLLEVLPLLLLSRL